MNTIKFYIALFISKTYLFVLKIFKQEKDDRPGYLAMKICPNFLSKVKKPKLVICITGTNGKTTTTNLVADLLKKAGKTVIYNDWGANLPSSAIRCLLDAVTIFNTRKKVDIGIFETDEIQSNIFFKGLKPNYLIVTNLFRDSIHRNAHSEYVFNKINSAITKNIKLILNADDPISSMLGENNKCIYYGINRLRTDRKQSIELVNDLLLCPKCNNKLIYDFSRYHHIGKVHCSKCNFKSKDNDYSIEKIDYANKLITINDYKYHMINDSIFNLYNELAAITLLNELKIDKDKINEYLKDTSITKSRHTNESINGIEIETYLCKGLNSVATSRVFNYISTRKETLEIIMTIDDQVDNKGGSESIGWIYDADFEFLNKDNIKRIIVGGKRSKDYLVRLLLAGIPRKKIFITEDELDTPNYIDKDVEKIFILYDVYFVTGANKIKSKVIKKIKEDINED